MKIKTRKAFTLVEVLMVVVIIGIFAGMSIPSYLRSQRMSQLINTSQGVLQLLNDARNRANSGWSSSVGADPSANTKINSFGVYLTRKDKACTDCDTGEYRQYAILFADREGGTQWELDGSDYIIDYLDGEYVDEATLQGMTGVSGLGGHYIFKADGSTYLTEMLAQKGSANTLYEDAYVFYTTQNLSPQVETYIRVKETGTDKTLTDIDGDKFNFLRLRYDTWDLDAAELEDAIGRSIVVRRVGNYNYLCLPSDSNPNDPDQAMCSATATL